MEESLFNDLVKGLNEAIAHERDEIALKVTERVQMILCQFTPNCPKKRKLFYYLLPTIC